MWKSLILFILLWMLATREAQSANVDGASNLGVDYAFLSLMTLSPDFAAANYVIHDSSGSNVNIQIARLPYQFELYSHDKACLNLELSLAYQRTTEITSTFPTPGENIDSTWNTLGAGLGLLFQYPISNNLFFTPSMRLGYTDMENHANYNGVQTNAIKNLFEGKYLNWHTNARINNLGLGVGYIREESEHISSINADIFHINVNSFNESDPAVNFNENANMMSIHGDWILPTGMKMYGSRISVVYILGTNTFFGENKNTLGYTTSYEGGIGAEFPLVTNNKKHGHLRLIGEILWANNMQGWYLSLGYKPK